MQDCQICLKSENLELIVNEDSTPSSTKLCLAALVKYILFKHLAITLKKGEKKKLMQKLLPTVG